MRKLIAGGMAVAMLAIIPSAASADVPRCEATVTSAATATFTVTSPNGGGGLWTTDFAVTVQPDGSFAGNGTTTGLDGGVTKTIAENVTGKFTDSNADGMADKVTFTSDRPEPLYVATWTVTDAPMDSTTETIATVNVNWTVAVKVTPPVFTAATTDDMNHGEYVSSVGGGKVAGQACKGMPLKSTQGTK